MKPNKGLKEAKDKAVIASIENDLRDLINFIKIKNTEELEVGEGKKIEDDTADELVVKIKKIATKIGVATM
ncbi:MAG: hypothetical protein K6T16_01880 [Candidatus Pacearchaeota archaeon]|nr:hypothetical protein [Candidatus Pacearchaeota archaeon]